MCDETHAACCAPSGGARRGVTATATLDAEARGSTDGMVLVPGAEFIMGTDDGIGYRADGEGPARRVTLDPFWIDAHAVSNARFAAFADATDYITDAERYGWSFVFAGLLPDDFPETRAVSAAPWWREVHGAHWRRPEGPHSSLDGRMDHPVVHASWNDAMAYTTWAGLRLPSEAEWECAARGGLDEQRYPWGDDLTPDGEHRCNIWQGTFPSNNTTEDGYYGTAPVGAYRANGFGLYNMSGNAWEWCADWFSVDWHATASPDRPKGPPHGVQRVIRGGSYLCHASYCHRYRVSARSANHPDSSTGHTGFRCARDV